MQHKIPYAVSNTNRVYHINSHCWPLINYVTWCNWDWSKLMQYEIHNYVTSRNISHTTLRNVQSRLPLLSPKASRGLALAHTNSDLSSQHRSDSAAVSNSSSERSCRTLLVHAYYSWNLRRSRSRAVAAQWLASLQLHLTGKWLVICLRRWWSRRWHST